jgi:hypothetical protein
MSGQTRHAARQSAETVLEIASGLDRAGQGDASFLLTVLLSIFFYHLKQLFLHFAAS